MCPILELQKKYYFTKILPTMIINKIQGPCLHFFQINHVLEIAPKKSYLFKNIQAIEACFADQNSQPLEIKDRINLTLVIK